MSIDRIGKGPGVPPTGAGSVDPVAPKGTFEVGAAAGPAEASAVSPAAQVASGQIDMKQYVELRVNDATKHLEGKLAPSDLDRVRATLREQIAHDPAIREMVRAATGALPPDGE